MAMNIESGKTLTFQNYEIVITEGKYGITDDKGNVVIDCVFDSIEWLPDEHLVKFCINNKYAICLITEIEKIKEKV